MRSIDVFSDEATSLINNKTLQMIGEHTTTALKSLKISEFHIRHFYKQIQIRELFPKIESLELIRCSFDSYASEWLLQNYNQLINLKLEESGKLKMAHRFPKLQVARFAHMEYKLTELEKFFVRNATLKDLSIITWSADSSKILRSISQHLLRLERIEIYITDYEEQAEHLGQLKFLMKLKITMCDSLISIEPYIITFAEHELPIEDLFMENVEINDHD